MPFSLATLLSFQSTFHTVWVWEVLVIIVKNGTVVIDKKYKKLMESYVLFKGNKSDFKKYKREEVYVYSEKNDECEALLKREETDYNESQYFFEASLEDIVAALCGNGKE